MKQPSARLRASWHDAIAQAQALYRGWHGRELRLDPPVRYTEKLQWRKLYDTNPLFPIFCDKWAVRAYIEQLLGPEVLVPVLWRGSDPEAIPFSTFKLPYVIKTSHGSAQTLVITHANRLEWRPRRIARQLAAWLAEPYGRETLETAYREVPRQILVEKLLVDKQNQPPIERRCFVFDGKVQMINTVLVEEGRVRNGAFHTPKWQRLLWWLGRPPLEQGFPKPRKLRQMIEMAERLGAGCDHLRIDFFDTGSKIWVGEITVYPWSGSAPFKPDEADFILGKWWKLPHPRAQAWLARQTRESPVEAPEPALEPVVEPVAEVKKPVVLRRKMIIHLYAVAWNEEKILPFFLRHYTPLVDRFFIADHGSTDRTPALLQACPKQTSREFLPRADSFVHALQVDGNECWKESRGQADWVIVCDLDEFLYHPRLLSYLREARRKGHTVLPAVGWQMVSDVFPKARETLTRTIPRGARFEEMDKTLIFNPDAIEEIGFSPGHHRANPTGEVVQPEMCELKVLHYKYLSARYMHERHRAMRARRGPVDLELCYGVQYGRSEAENIAQFELFKAAAVEVIPQKGGFLRWLGNFSFATPSRRP